MRPVALAKETTFKDWTARSMLSSGPDFFTAMTTQRVVLWLTRD